LDNVLDFNIKAVSGYGGFGKGVLKYPYTFSTYNQVFNTQLLSPKKGVLQSGATENFVMSSKDFTNIALIINGEFTQLVKNAKTGNFELNFEVPAGITQIDIMGSRNGRNYSGLLRYDVVQ
jgi:hypothetical protein